MLELSDEKSLDDYNPFLPDIHVWAKRMTKLGKFLFIVLDTDNLEKKKGYYGNIQLMYRVG